MTARLAAFALVALVAGGCDSQDVGEPGVLPVAVALDGERPRVAVHAGDLARTAEADAPARSAPVALATAGGRTFTVYSRTPRGYTLAEVDPATGRPTAEAETSGPLVAASAGLVATFGPSPGEGLALHAPGDLRPLGRLDVPTWAAAFGPGGRLYLLTGDRAGAELRAYDVSDPAAPAETDRVALAPDVVPVDLDVSPDGRALFATVFEPMGLDGVGALVVVDAAASGLRVRSTHPAGKYSGVAVGAGGRYVYVDDPAGGLRQLTPTNRVLRYDVAADRVDVFLDGPGSLGLEGTALVTSAITALPDEGALVMAVAVAALPDGSFPSLVRVDEATGRRTASYVPPRDGRGFVTEQVRAIAPVAASAPAATPRQRGQGRR